MVSSAQRLLPLLKWWKEVSARTVLHVSASCGHDCTGDTPEVGETSAVPINVNEEGSSRVSGSSFLQPWSACEKRCGERQFLVFSAAGENAR